MRTSFARKPLQQSSIPSQYQLHSHAVEAAERNSLYVSDCCACKLRGCLLPTHVCVRDMRYTQARYVQVPSVKGALPLELEVQVDRS